MMLPPFNYIYRDLLHYKCRFGWSRTEQLVLIGPQKPFPASYSICYDLRLLVPFMINLETTQ